MASPTALPRGPLIMWTEGARDQRVMRLQMGQTLKPGWARRHLVGQTTDRSDDIVG